MLCNHEKDTNMDKVRWDGDEMTKSPKMEKHWTLKMFKWATISKWLTFEWKSAENYFFHCFSRKNKVMAVYLAF